MATVAKTSIQINTAQATAALQTLNVNLNATLGGFEGLERALNANTAALRQTKAAGTRYNNTQRQVNATARQGQSAFAGLASKIGALAASYVGLQTAQKFIQEADAYASITARLNVMNDKLQTTDKLYNKIYMSAQRARAGFNETASAIAKLGVVAGDSFKSNDEIIAFIETFNKAAAVSGASASESSNAMYQLSQAFASGRLQGDELRSVRENAPMLYKAIQKELEAQFGKGKDFKKLAADGLITPDVIKAAAFKSAGEINKAFASMPMTFSQTMTQAFNKVRAGLAPVFQDVQRIINNPATKAAINNVANFAIKALSWIWGAIKKLASGISWAVGVIRKVMPALKPVIIAVGTLVAVTKTYLFVMKVWAGLVGVWKSACFMFAVAKMLLGGATSYATKATLYQTWAQMGLNKAQMVGLAILTKVVLIILLIVGVIWAVIQLINLCCDTSISVCGVIYGAVLVLAAGISNIVLGLWNMILTWLDNLVDPFIGIAEFIYNCFHGGFTSWMGAVQNAFGQLVSALLGTLKPLLEVWDMVFDTNAVAKVTGWQNTAKGWGKNENAATFDTGYLRKNFGASKDLRTGYGDAWNYGYKKGEAFGSAFDGLGDLAGFDVDKLNLNGIPTDATLNSLLGDIGDPSTFGTGDDALKKALNDIAKNTKQTAENTGEKEDDYELLRDVMRQRAINRLGNSSSSVKVEMVNNNNLSSQLDVNSFLSQLAKAMNEAASTAAQGVHV